MALPIPVRLDTLTSCTEKVYEATGCLARAFISRVLSSIACSCAHLCTYVRVLCYRTKAENQYDITLRPASSRLVTEISGKTGRDELVKVSFTWHRDRQRDRLLFSAALSPRATHTPSSCHGWCIEVLRISIVFVAKDDNPACPVAAAVHLVNFDLAYSPHGRPPKARTSSRISRNFRPTFELGAFQHLYTPKDRCVFGTHKVILDASK